MAIGQRTATSGVAASGAAFTVTLPTGSTTADIILLAVANAGTAGPATPAGWNFINTWSAGTGQSITAFWALWSAGLTTSFTNAASVAAWCCNAFTGCDPTNPVRDTPAATSLTTNNSTLPTGAPTTGNVAGDYEALCYVWTSAATITTVATGSTIDKTQANSTTVSCAMGHNNTTSLGASTATTAFSQTLSASNSRKTGVGILLNGILLTGGVVTKAETSGAPSLRLNDDVTAIATASGAAGAPNMSLGSISVGAGGALAGDPNLKLVGAAQAAATPTASLTLGLSAGIIGQGAPDGALTVTSSGIVLAGGSAGQALVQGALSLAVAGGSSSQAVAASALQLALAGAAVAQASDTGALRLALVGQSLAQVADVGALSLSLASSIAGQAVSAGALQELLSGQAQAQALAAAAPRLGLSGALLAQALTDGKLGLAFAGQVLGASVMSGLMISGMPLAGMAGAQALASGALIELLQAASQGSAVTDGVLTIVIVYLQLVGAAAGQASAAGSIISAVYTGGVEPFVVTTSPSGSQSVTSVSGTTVVTDSKGNSVVTA